MGLRTGLSPRRPVGWLGGRFVVGSGRVQAVLLPLLQLIERVHDLALEPEELRALALRAPVGQRAHGNLAFEVFVNLGRGEAPLRASGTHQNTGPSSSDCGEVAEVWSPDSVAAGSCA